MSCKMGNFMNLRVFALLGVLLLAGCSGLSVRHLPSNPWKNEASRHHDAPLAGTNSRLSSHKKGQAVNTGPPLSVWHMRNAYFSSALSDTSIRRPAVPSGCVSVSTRRYPKEIESG